MNTYKINGTVIKANSVLDAVQISKRLNDEENSKAELKFLIDDELEAIDNYNKAIKSADDDYIIEVLTHIMNEEKEHVNELTNLMSRTVQDSITDDQ